MNAIYSPQPGQARGPRGIVWEHVRMLHHVALEVRPEDAARDGRFWVAAGFNPVPAPAALGPGYDWFELGGTQIHLMRSDQPVIPARGHVAIRTPDLEAVLGRLERLGIEVREGRQLWGKRRVKATLPSGHVVELMAAAPHPA